MAHTPCERSMSQRIAPTSRASPDPFGSMSAPWPASNLAVPSPIPLVEPVTIATFPCNIAVLFCVAA
jgi:hypothetical protein